jgi:uncharacterized protein YlxP (DUF503 family)
MRIALLTLSYRLYSVESLKQKRSIVKHILAEIQRQGVAFAGCEIESDDRLDLAVIRVAHLSEDTGFSDSSLHRVQRRIERGDGYEVFDSEMEIL